MIAPHHVGFLCFSLFFFDRKIPTHHMKLDGCSGASPTRMPVTTIIVCLGDANWNLHLPLASKEVGTSQYIHMWKQPICFWLSRQIVGTLGKEYPNTCSQNNQEIGTCWYIDGFLWSGPAFSFRISSNKPRNAFGGHLLPWPFLGYNPGAESAETPNGGLYGSWAVTQIQVKFHEVLGIRIVFHVYP